MARRGLHKHTVDDPLAQVKKHNVAYLEEDWSLTAWQRRVVCPLYEKKRQIKNI